MMMIHLCKYIPSLRSFTMLLFLVLVILQDSEKVEKAFCIGSNKTAGSVHKVQTFGKAVHQKIMKNVQYHTVLIDIVYGPTGLKRINEIAKKMWKTGYEYGTLVHFVYIGLVTVFKVWHHVDQIP